MLPTRILLFLFLFLIIIVISGDVTTSLSTNGTFPNCNRTFTCGSFVNITYPFTGGDRSDYCGPPDFRLTCRNEFPELTIESLTYRVLGLNQTGETLTLARLDLWNNTCPAQFINSTLNFTIFNDDVAVNELLTLFYACSSITAYTPSNAFKCNVNGTSSDAYYLVGPSPTDPSLMIIKCNTSVTVPILAMAAERFNANQTTLGEVLTEGFNVNYTTPNDALCLACLQSGGQCGYDSDFGKFACFCGDRLCNVTGHVGGINWKGKLIIGVTGVIAASIFLLCCIRGKRFFYKVIVFWRKDTEADQNIKEFIRNCGSLAPQQFSYSDVKRMTNSFKDKLGQGGYGGVYKGQLPDGRVVAVKVLNESKGNGEEFINEVASISRTSHVNVVTLLGFCYKRTKRALIYEFMPNGSLDKFIYEGPQKTNHPLEWDKLYQIAVGIARGLEYLHRGCNTRILHFDIKPHNILLDEDFVPKISDFGLAKLCQRKDSIVSMLGARGTAGYIAPEVFSRNFGGVSHKSDVYSYGMMVLEMVGGRKKIEVEESQTSEIYFPHWIYKQLDPGEDLRLHGVETEEEAEISRKMVLVGLWCIQTIPSDRPSMSKVLEMLEGNPQSLRVPPKPFLSSPPIPLQHSSTTSLS